MTDESDTQVASKSMEDRLREAPPADWVLAMIEHHRRTGTYRPRDLRRLLGDPTKGVEMSARSSLAACLASKRS